MASPRKHRQLALIAIAFIALMWIGWVFLGPQSPPDGPTFRRRMPEKANLGAAVSELADEAKSRIQGGIGIGISKDAITGQFKVMTVLSNSPALAAGLKTGDTILEVNGQSMAPVPLVDAITLLRGIKLTTVDLKIQHPAATNFEHILIKRPSFKEVMDGSKRP